MLTRLKVSGFKNLVDVDVRFGPFTCIAGPNGVGKSNMFDAITFLSALANNPLVDAASSVRDAGGGMADLRSLFHYVGDEYDPEMSFEAEMIVPYKGIDDLGQPAQAKITFLRYSLKIAYRENSNQPSLGSLELTKEELVHINKSDAHKHLLFPHNVAKWRKSAVRGARRSPFISTEKEGDNLLIKRHQDGSGGRPQSFLAANLPRTVLSVANATESPTALLARREMQSWRLLQLEPSALRKPDEFNASPHLGKDGSHLAATLYHLARQKHNHQQNGEPDAAATAQIYAQVANRLSELIDDVQEVGVDRDERRELLTLHVTDREGTPYPARSLSDGTLRFLALAVLEQDPESQGLICLEEPENGIHPGRIPAMLRLLQDIGTDVDEEIGPDNPLHQVIINTHSPAVVSQVPDDSLLVAELKETIREGRRFKRLCFGCLPGTWRQKKEEKAHVIAKGDLLAYLNPVITREQATDFYVNGKDHERSRTKRQKTRRVADRPDLQLLLPFRSEP